jgi:hypothetical protein
MLHHTKSSKSDAAPLSERRKHIYDFLHMNPVGVLSTVTADGDPHGVVVYFCVNKNYTLSFLTKVLTHKYDNLMHNNRVMLTVYEPGTQTCVQVTGKTTELRGSTEINAIAGAILGASLKTSRAGIPPISKIEAGPYVGFEIEPLQLRMAAYGKQDPGQYEARYEMLEAHEVHAPDPRP